MILYANGPSDMLGHGLLPGQPSYISLVAQHFGLDLVNDAAGGCSNDRILRVSQEWLEKNQQNCALALIAWTTWERTEWWFQGQWHQVNASGECPKMMITCQDRAGSGTIRSGSGTKHWRCRMCSGIPCLVFRDQRNMIGNSLFLIPMITLAVIIGH